MLNLCNLQLNRRNFWEVNNSVQQIRLYLWLKLYCCHCFSAQGLIRKAWTNNWKRSVALDLVQIRPRDNVRQALEKKLAWLLDFMAGKTVHHSIREWKFLELTPATATRWNGAQKFWLQNLWLLLIFHFGLKSLFWHWIVWIVRHFSECLPTY